MVTPHIYSISYILLLYSELLVLQYVNRLITESLLIVHFSAIAKGKPSSAVV